MKRKPKAALPVELREWANVQHDFTDPEKLELSKRHVSALQRIGELKAQIQTVTGDLKSKIKTEQALVDELTTRLSNGYEMQSKECRIVMNRKTGLKSLYIIAPGTPHHDKFVREEAMTQTDYEKLPLDDTPAAPAKKEKPLSKKAAKKAAKEAEEALKKNQVAGEEGAKN